MKGEQSMPRKGENIYRRKDGRWEARYIYAYSINGKAQYRSVYAGNYSEARKKKWKALENISSPEETELNDADSKSITYYGLLWLKSIKISTKESTYVKYRLICSNYIDPKIGDIKVSHFNNESYEEFINQLLTAGRKDGMGLATKTVSDIRSVLKGIFSIAEKEGELLQCNLTILPIKVTNKPFRVLTTKEQQILQDYLLKNMNSWNLGILISLYTGIRLGEICALQWQDIKLNDQCIEVTKTVQRIKDYSEEADSKTKLSATTPKTICSIRRIPVPQFLVEILKENREKNEVYLVTGLSHKLPEPRTMEYRFHKVLEKCSLEKAHFHTLRHTFATRCVELGFDVKTLSEILGHTNIGTTLNRYVHPSMELKQQSMEKLEDIFAVKKTGQ